MLFSVVEIELFVVDLFLFSEQISPRISLSSKQVNQWGRGLRCNRVFLVTGVFSPNTLGKTLSNTQ
jgi:hypothetical protein